MVRSKFVQLVVNIVGNPRVLLPRPVPVPVTGNPQVCSYLWYDS